MSAANVKCQAKRQPCQNPRCPERQAFFAGTAAASKANAPAAPKKLTLKEQRQAARDKRDFASNTVLDARQKARTTSNQEEIRGFLRNKDAILRIQAAANPNSDADTLQQFSTDSDWGVRKAVAAHKNTSQDVLKKLAEDSEGFVSSTAKSRL